MAITDLWLVDFRCFAEVHVQPDPDGLTVLRGLNGAGKTSVLEALAWLATQKSMRGAPREALVRAGTERAVVRGRARHRERVVWIEAEIPRHGSGRALVNRHPVSRRSELGEVLQVTVFSPDDLHLVQGGPASRRDYLDDVLVDRHPRLDALVSEVERVLRQRAALLRQMAGRPDDAALTTLEVWDARLASAGTELVAARETLLTELEPRVSAAFEELAGGSEGVILRYDRSWTGDLSAAVSARRDEDVRRQGTSVGPHRDDLNIAIAGRSVRTLASQGEQRCVALALRLATHEVRRQRAGQPPVLLLDDVFSELDERRGAALLELLPGGQVLLTTAVGPPTGAHPAQVIEVAGGRLSGAMPS